MALNPSIILAGQAPDILGATNAGRIAAEGQINLNRQNALAALYKEQGPGIMAGEQGALNSLAQFDPMAAQGVQGNVLGLQAQRQEMEFSAERMQMARDEGKRMAAEALAAQAANLTAEQLAAEKEQITKGLSGAAFFYQNKDRAGYEKFLSENGMDPAEFPFEAFPAHAAMFEGALEAMESFAPPAGPEWVVATPEQAARYGANAGQLNTATGEFKRTPTEKNMVIESTPGGGFRLIEGEGAAGGGMKPSDPALMISSIDAILADPALETSTGMLSPLQYIPGTPQKRFQTRAKQLEGQAFLQAFESLKGAGQITEIEGQKATQAIGRLDTSQSADDYRQALTELREVLALGASRPPGWAEQNAAPGATPEAPPATPKRLRWSPETGAVE